MATIFLRRLSFVLPLLVSLSGIWPGSLSCRANPFPNPPEIQPVVQFWLSIYTRYDLDQGVVHDSRHPEIIYDIIELKHPDTPRAHRINDNRMRKARKKYRRLIDRYLASPNSQDPDLRRFAGLFGADATPDQLMAAQRRIRCQVGQRERFRAGLVRSGPYIAEIRQIFHDNGIPEDLAYLPHVESSFNPRAHSKSGAVGIWQFTRRTGRHYLQIDHLVDERYDPILASRAAARLLRTNYRRLDSWPLAITAYNHGLAGMRRARRRHKSYAAIYQNYQSRRFRFASRNFYPEFLAAREAAANAHLYFEDLPPQSPTQPTLTVTANGFVPFLAMANHFKLEADLLRQLNPALRPSVLKGRQHAPQDYAWRLPANEWQYRLAYNARIPEALLHGQQKPNPVYRVRRGDTISSIARRHNISVADLVAANNLPKRGNRIFVNQKLRLPVTHNRL
jgi:membrane-bound lytic murein transglycosylase D